jgi:two-component system NtrC family sensor kinase
MQKNPLILFALDDSPFRQLGERALRSAGYDIAIAHDRDGLMRSLQESSPSLLLMGEHLEGASGLTLAAEQLERFPTLPILLYADKDSPATAREVIRLGLAGYIFPPLRTDDMVATVKRALERARSLGDWVRSEVRRSTASLQRQVDDFEIIFNNIGDGVIILDGQQRTLLINQAAAQTFGVSAANVMGKPLAKEVPHPDLLSMLENPPQDALHFHEICFDDGRVFNAQVVPIPTMGLAITLQEISYIKEIDQIKSDFVQTISHDLRSPLTSVLGYADLIQRTGPLNDSQDEFMRRLQASAKDMTSLINNLLDLGRLEAGYDSRREIVRLDNIISYTLDVLIGQISARNLVINYQTDPNLPAVRGNTLRLRQMFDNLMGNAIKYSLPGGEILIHLRSDSGQVILEVTDQGPGIPPSDQPHIFDKFYRGTNVPEGVGGSGLGLSIVKSIVESHQGRIWVESVVGQGSTFFVVLPAQTAPIS